MNDDTPQPEPEIHICDACGRDYRLDAETVVNPVQREFCPKCLSPYLLQPDEE